jgi:hypothetical protein
MKGSYSTVRGGEFDLDEELEGEDRVQHQIHHLIVRFSVFSFWSSVSVFGFSVVAYQFSVFVFRFFLAFGFGVWQVGFRVSGLR